MNPTSCANLTADLTLEADVVIVGSGAGGSVLAARLAALGRDVVVLEAGGYHTAADFRKVDERWSYPALYQDRGARSTTDLGITILQGRTVGGGTVVNWTTCFRTPDRILEHWRDVHGTTLTRAELEPHWEAIESRLNIEPWALPPNANNDVLRRGCEALGWEHQILRRNVRGCANSGLCGLGCPVDAKQGMQLTYLADAEALGARVYSDVEVTRVVVEAGRAVGVEGRAMIRGADRPLGPQVRVRAKQVVCSGGAINTPALLLRSGLDQGGLVGRRTFFHPVVAVLGSHPTKIDPYYGAPQSVSSHQFVERGADKVGYFLEVAPLQPMLAASSGWTSGPDLQDLMRNLGNVSVVIGLMIDGVLPGDDGGTIGLRSDGRIAIDYPIRPATLEAMREAHLSAARILLAAGADEVATTHVQPVRARDEAGLTAFTNARYGTQEHGIFTAHQMGGCPMGDDPKRHVVDLDLAFRGVAGLYVVDGSVLPTALGVNPSQTIYGLAHWIAPSIHAAAG